MGKRYLVEGEKMFFDICPPERFLDSHRDGLPIKDKLKSAEYFEGKQSYQFYLGMIAAFRSIISIQRSMGNKEEMEEFMTDTTVMATFLAIEKQNPE